jgi:hypothetical protein
MVETHELIPRSRMLLEKLIVVRLLKKFSEFYEIRMVIIVFTRFRH